MWIAQIKRSELEKSGGWRVERFAKEAILDWDSRFPRASLGEVALEREETADPTSQTWRHLPYVGLENVAPHSGDLTEVVSASERRIRSRSKVFRGGDVLYGRLRAYLNKVYFAEGPVASGICSGEFYVLIPNPSKLNGRFLRWILASDQMMSHVRGRLAGATHPRLGIEDLLGFAFPLPSIEDQEIVARFLDYQHNRLQRLRQRMVAIPQAIKASINNFLVDGDQDVLRTRQESALSTLR